MRQIAQSRSFLRLSGQTICVGRLRDRSDEVPMSFASERGELGTGARAENQPGDYGS